MYFNLKAPSFHILKSVNTLFLTYPWEICSKTSSRCLKLQVVLNPVCVYIYVYYDFFLYIHTFSFKGSSLQLLFGVSKLPASLLFHFGTIIKYNNGTLNTSTSSVNLLTEMSIKSGVHKPQATDQYRSSDCLEPAMREAHLSSTSCPPIPTPVCGKTGPWC